MKSKEGNKAFESAWIELKKAGYLKQYMQPVGNSWQVEYDLLDEPDYSWDVANMTKRIKGRR